MGFVGERSQPTQRPSLVATTIDFMVQCHQQRVDRSFLETILFSLPFLSSTNVITLKNQN